MSDSGRNQQDRDCISLFSLLLCSYLPLHQMYQPFNTRPTYSFLFSWLLYSEGLSILSTQQWKRIRKYPKMHYIAQKIMSWMNSSILGNRRTCEENFPRDCSLLGFQLLCPRHLQLAVNCPPISPITLPSAADPYASCQQLHKDLWVGNNASWYQS